MRPLPLIVNLVRSPRPSTASANRNGLGDLGVLARGNLDSSEVLQLTIRSEKSFGMQPAGSFLEKSPLTHAAKDWKMLGCGKKDYAVLLSSSLS